MTPREPESRVVRRSPDRHLVLLGACSLLALALRLVRLTEPALRWDEGWSLAHASLSWSEVLRVATLEWHPPVYAALLKGWLVFGKSALAIRSLSVLAGVAAVPLTYAVALAWSGRRRLALWAALLAATWPLLVYYGQVARPYALMALPVLGAAWFALRGPSPRHDAGLVVASALALYVHYYSVWALVGIWVYAAIAQPRRSGRLLLLALAAGVLYAPWLLLARGSLGARLGSAGDGLAEAWRGTGALLRPTLEGLFFTYGSGWRAALALIAVVTAGALAGPLDRKEARLLLLPLLVVGISTVGIAFGAALSHWFAVRYLVPASVFLGMVVAWALERLAARGWPLAAVALVVLAVAYWPTSTRFVYEKTLEVVDPFDPAEDHRYLAERAGPDDVVFFNVLARAGWYEAERRRGDPAWAYAMRWDPIIEPLDDIAARVTATASAHPRLWFALYMGDYGPNAPLVAWLNEHLYPASAEWRGDMLYLAFVAPPSTWESQAVVAAYSNGIRLENARWTPQSTPGGPAALELTWRCEAPVSQNYKVFVHALDATGKPQAQHDALLGTEAHPATSWQVGEAITERHGLLLPTATPPGLLRLVVGLYDPDTGERLLLTNGQDAIPLGAIDVR